MRIVVDGQPETVKSGATVLDVLQRRNEPTAHVLVEINGSFVHPREYGDIFLRPGDRMEVILPAFGG